MNNVSAPETCFSNADQGEGNDIWAGRKKLNRITCRLDPSVFVYDKRLDDDNHIVVTTIL